MNLKGELLSEAKDIIDQRIIDAKNSLLAARESRDSETKSSMGDKYEIGRAMVQLEMDKLQNQMDNALKLKKALLQIDPEKIMEQAAFGSLVFTNNGTYMISVGLGIVQFKKEKFFFISMASPIGKELIDKRAGDKFTFQGRNFEILKIE